ncbi:hypothetical protein I79_024831 [Cricetulus griseus]|uniref:Uncharacterized protein n=1 Tax=Cricetulus griseus TaxID=10029 RepID=G3ILR0_CRIGR|nr:hypothetical protein I79_024831 [Cricetulus griseus]
MDSPVQLCVLCSSCPQPAAKGVSLLLLPGQSDFSPPPKPIRSTLAQCWPACVQPAMHTVPEILM